LFAQAGVGIAAFAIATKNKPLKTVGHVELGKYMGKWYGIAKFPRGIEKGASKLLDTRKLVKTIPEGAIRFLS